MALCPPFALNTIEEFLRVISIFCHFWKYLGMYIKTVPNTILHGGESAYHRDENWRIGLGNPSEFTRGVGTLISVHNMRKWATETTDCIKVAVIER